MTARDLLDRLAAEGLSPELLARASWTTWSNGPRDTYGAHAHDYDKVLVATRGAITFRLLASDRAVELAAGHRLELRAGTRHAAVVGPSGVECLELHLPAGALDSRTPAARETGQAGEA